MELSSKIGLGNSKLLINGLKNYQQFFLHVEQIIMLLLTSKLNSLKSISNNRHNYSFCFLTFDKSIKHLIDSC